MNAPRSVAAVASPEQSRSIHEHIDVPVEVFTGPDALQRAVRSDSDWIWLLGPRVTPDPDALESLLKAARAPAPGTSSPALLAGGVRDHDGAYVIRELPAGHEHNPEVVEAVARRSLPIRNATFANCLVARACFDAHGLPDRRRYGPFADVEWSARVLRVETGYFVPASVVTLERGGARSDAMWVFLPLLRMLRTGAWTRGDAASALRWWLHDVAAPAAGGAG